MSLNAGARTRMTCVPYITPGAVFFSKQDTRRSLCVNLLSFFFFSSAHESGLVTPSDRTAEAADRDSANSRKRLRKTKDALLRFSTALLRVAG